MYFMWAVLFILLCCKGLLRTTLSFNRSSPTNRSDMRRVRPFIIAIIAVLLTAAIAYLLYRPAAKPVDSCFVSIKIEPTPVLGGSAYALSFSCEGGRSLMVSASNGVFDVEEDAETYNVKAEGQMLRWLPIGDDGSLIKDDNVYVKIIQKEDRRYTGFAVIVLIRDGGTDDAYYYPVQLKCAEYSGSLGKYPYITEQMLNSEADRYAVPVQQNDYYCLYPMDSNAINRGNYDRNTVVICSSENSSYTYVVSAEDGKLISETASDDPLSAGGAYIEWSDVRKDGTIVDSSCVITKILVENKTGNCVACAIVAMIRKPWAKESMSGKSSYAYYPMTVYFKPFSSPTSLEYGEKALAEAKQIWGCLNSPKCKQIINID